MNTHIGLATDQFPRPRRPRLRGKSDMETSFAREDRDSSNEVVSCSKCDVLGQRMDEIFKWLDHLEGLLNQHFETFEEQSGMLKEQLGDIKRKQQNDGKYLDQLRLLGLDFGWLGQALENYKETGQSTRSTIRDGNGETKGNVF